MEATSKAKADGATGSRWPRASLRAYLVAMILLATLPLAAFMGYEVVDDVRQQRKSLQATLQALATAAAARVDAELGSSLDALTTLAQAESLRDDRLADFARVLDTSGALRPMWSAAYLLAPDGEVLLRSPATPNDGASERELAAWSRAPETARSLGRDTPVVKNLVGTDGRGPRRTVLAVRVVRPQGPHLLLAASIDFDRWQAVLERGAALDGGFTTLFDAQHRVLARTSSPERYVGGALPPDSVASIAGRDAGVGQFRVVVQTDGYVAWQMLTHAGWGVGAGMPGAALDAADRRTALLTAGAALACLLLGVTAAFVVARRIGAPLARLARGGASSHSDAASEVAEIRALRDALARADAERRAATDTLAGKAEEFETLFRSSPVGLAFAQDSRCDVVLRNAVMDEIVPDGIALGRSERPAQSHAEVCCDGEALPPERWPLRLAASSGEPVAPMELELRAPGQATRFVIASAAPLHDPHGRPRGAIGAVVDITERERSRARLRASEQLQRRSQSLLDMAQDVGNVGFVYFQFASRTLVWSPGHGRLFGAEPSDEATPQRIWRERVGAAERRRVVGELRRMTAAGVHHGILELGLHAEGRPARWLQSRVLITYCADGAPLQLMGVTIDITEQRRAEIDREQMIVREQAARQDAEGANRAKDEFLSMLGHELRNPLNAIATSMQVLNRVQAGAPEAISARAIVSRQTLKLSRMMDELLDVGRVIADDVELLRQPFDLAPLVQRGVVSAQARAAVRGQTLNATLGDARVNADAQRIAQVVEELLGNAIRYSPADGHIDVTLAREGGDAVLRVRNDGPGIPPDLQRRIFEPFVQGERGLDRHNGGLGIGLTLVRRLIEMHGGAVSLVSDTGGSAFEVRLRAIDADDDDALPVAAPRRARNCVAVIDDNPDALYGLRSMLELDGHTVRTATDGVAGLALLIEAAPDVAIVDIGLPGIDGYEVAKRSRAEGYAGRLIALSGYGRQQDLRRSRAAGFDAHLVKPVDADALQRLLGAAV